MAPTPEPQNSISDIPEFSLTSPKNNSTPWALQQLTPPSGYELCRLGDRELGVGLVHSFRLMQYGGACSTKER